MASFLRKYGAAATIEVPLIGAAVQDFTLSATFSAGDVQVSKDGGAFTNIGTLPTHVGKGVYQVSLSAAEMTAARVVVVLVDAATKVWEDQSVIIDTYGNASASHPFDLGTAMSGQSVSSVAGSVGSVTGAVGSVTGSVASVTGAVGSVTGAVGSVTAMVTANTTQISGDAVAADNCEAFFDGTGYAGGTTKLNVGTATSVSGSVGSVTGAVGSVTATVGANLLTWLGTTPLALSSQRPQVLTVANNDKTGYSGTVTSGTVTTVSGNVNGSVGSVTGAVGSVTGNVNGNVVGSVGSVTTVNDKTGYALSTAGEDSVVNKVWDELTGEVRLSTSYGQLLKDNVNATIGSRSTHSAADVWSAATRTITGTEASAITSTSFASAAITSTALANSAVGFFWDVLTGDARDIGSYGQLLKDNLDAKVSTAGGATAQQVWEYATRDLTVKTGFALSTGAEDSLVDKIWDEPRTGHVTAGTFGLYLDAQVSTVGGGAAPTAQENATAVWDELTATARAVGSYGQLVKDNVNATIASRLASADIALSGGAVTVDTNNDKAGYSISGIKTTLDSLNDVTAVGVWAAATRTLTANTNLNDPTAAQIADQVWDEATADHVGVGSFGKFLADQLNATVGSRSSHAAADIWSVGTRTITGGTVTTVSDKTGYSISGTKTTLDALNDLAIADVQTAMTNQGYTTGRSPYLDNLNVGGLVASSAEVSAIQNNTRVVFAVPSVMERPDAGNQDYRLWLYLYDSAGNMEAPDALPTITAENNVGTDRSSGLGVVTNVSTGVYRVNYTVASTDAIEAIKFEFSIIEGGATRLVARQTHVVDTTAVDFTAADRAKLDSIDTRLPSTLIAGRIDANAQVVGDKTGYALASGSIVAGTFAASAIDATAFSQAAADKVWDTTTRALTEKAGFTISGTKTTLDALNDLSAAAVNAEVDTALADYDAPTKAEMDAGFAALNDVTAQQVWDALTANLTTAGSIGKLLSDNVDATIGSRSTHAAADIWSVGAREITGGTITTNGDKTGYSLTTAEHDAIVDKIWDELQAGHTTVGSFGKFLDVEVSSISHAAVPTAEEIADQVWDEATVGHVAAGSFGKFLADQLDVTVGSRSSHVAADIWSVVTREITGGAITTVSDKTGYSISGTKQTLDALNDITVAAITGATLSELAPGQPPATPTLAQAMMLGYMHLRNDLETDALEKRIHNDAGAVVAKGTLSDDGTTFKKAKLVSGV
jgi:hypothetical protein